MSWNTSRGPRRTDKVAGDDLLLSSPISWMIAVAAVALAGFLSHGLLFEENGRPASIEKMTDERLRAFVAEHSWLDYTTEGGETLAKLTRSLRLGDPGRLRNDNEQLAEVGDDEPLEAGLKLRVRYNELEVEGFLEQGE